MKNYKEYIQEKFKLHPELVALEKEIDAFHERTKHHKYLPKKESAELDKLEKKKDEIRKRIGVM